LAVFLVVEIMVMVMVVEMEGEDDKLMALIPSSLVLSLEEDQEAATVGGRKDKPQGKINQEQGSLGWILFLVEATITAVTVLHSPTTIMVDTTMVTIMVTTMGTTMVKIMVEVVTTVDTIMAEATADITVDTTAETTYHNNKGASVTTV